jgi:two-component system sensor histidine kinase/response regulator
MDKAGHIISKYRYFILAFILLEILMHFGSNYIYNNNSSQYNIQKEKEFEIGFKAVIHHFELTSNSFYSEINSDFNIVPLLKEAREADGVRKDEIRRILFAKLNPVYNQMKQNNLEYLSFFMPDNQALLRFSHPDFYGDNMKSAHSLVSAVNTTRKPATGFETGLASAGYRFVYPIFDHDQYLGCIELGVGFTGIRKELKRIFLYELRFLIDKTQLLNSTPFVKLDKFSFSDLSEDFMYEKPSHTTFEMFSSQVVKNENIVEFNKKEKRGIEENLSTKRTFGQSSKLSGGDFYALFYAIKDANKNTAAYIIAYAKDSTTLAYKYDYYIILVAGSIFILLIILLMGFIYSKNLIIRQSNAQLLHSEKQLKEMNAAKDKFFSIIAHDLRNPFHGLVGLTQVLVEDGDTIDPERTRKFHRLIYDSAKQGYQLVLNLLEWTRAQTGRLIISPEKIQLALLIDENYMLIKNSAESKHIKIVIRVDNTLYVLADENMLSTVIRNLLSNAVKFSYPGSEVLVTAQMAGNMAEITITDFGIGMEKSVTENLFKIEVSQSSAGTEGEQGTGLGLILCREFVEKNKGTLTFTSEPGKGSSFTVLIPLF